MLSIKFAQFHGILKWAPGVLLWFCYTTSLAQPAASGLLQGQLTNAFNCYPIQGASVKLWQSGTVISEYNTDEDGKFALSFPSGSITLADAYIMVKAHGYSDQYLELNVNYGQ